MKLLGAVLPCWVRWLVLSVAGAFVFMLGCMRGERIAGQRHIDYITAQARQSIQIAKAQEKVVTKTEIRYRDRIHTIVAQSDALIKEVPIHVSPIDNDRCSINAGFVRVHDAAWGGEPTRSAAESDHEPAGVSLAEVAETGVFNASACRAWREQALGFREFYKQLNAVTTSGGE